MGIFMGSAMLPSSLVPSFSPETFFSAVADHGLLVASLNYSHEAVSISGRAGKSKEQEQAANGC